MTRRLRLISLLLLFIFDFTPAFAWKVVKSKGHVKVVVNKKIQVLVIGNELPSNTVISTVKNSRAELQDGSSTISLGSSTRLQLGNTMRLFKGKIRAKIKGKKKNLKFKTPQSSALIRGTEFYISVNNSEETFATIKGLVEVSRNKNTIVLPAGAGVTLKKGQPSKIGKNSSYRILNWMSSSTFDEPGTVANSKRRSKGKSKSRWKRKGKGLSNNYKTSPRGRKSKQKHYWDIESDMFVGYVVNTDFNSSKKNNDELSHFQWRFEPTYQYGVKTYLRVTPVFYLHYSDENTILDTSPYLVRNGPYSGGGLGELHYHRQKKSHNYTIGVQRIIWNDGILISDKPWDIDNNSYLGVRYIQDYKNWDIEALYASSASDTNHVNGISTVTQYGLKVDSPKKWGNIFALYRQFPDLFHPVGDFNGIYRELHNLLDIGIFSERKFKGWDYRLTYIYQEGTIWKGSTGIDPLNNDEFERESSVGMGDLDLGYNIQPNLRLGLRGIVAGKNYVYGDEPYYKMGYANIFRRYNIQMIRTKISWQPNDNHELDLEFLTGRSLGRGFDWRSWIVDGIIGSELDLLYKWRVNPNFSVINSLYYFIPGDAHPSPGQKDPLLGFRTNFSFNL